LGGDHLWQGCAKIGLRKTNRICRFTAVTGTEYVALFPNLLLGVHRDHCYGIIFVPDGPNRTIKHI
jgi:hypothetical protein